MDKFFDIKNFNSLKSPHLNPQVWPDPKELPKAQLQKVYSTKLQYSLYHLGYPTLENRYNDRDRDRHGDLKSFCWIGWGSIGVHYVGCSAAVG